MDELESVEPASVTVKVKPDLSELRAFLSDMLAVIDRHDAASAD
ncbi:hypothetical protein [Bifidobacterium jacchi]|nr:hypothetical protein [Bifidobacterium jacchi]